MRTSQATRVPPLLATLGDEEHEGAGPIDLGAGGAVEIDDVEGMAGGAEPGAVARCERQFVPNLCQHTPAVPDLNMTRSCISQLTGTRKILRNQATLGA